MVAFAGPLVRICRDRLHFRSFGAGSSVNVTEKTLGSNWNWQAQLGRRRADGSVMLGKTGGEGACLRLVHADRRRGCMYFRPDLMGDFLMALQRKVEKIFGLVCVDREGGDRKSVTADELFDV